MEAISFTAPAGLKEALTVAVEMFDNALKEVSLETKKEQ